MSSGLLALRLASRLAPVVVTVRRIPRRYFSRRFLLPGLKPLSFGPGLALAVISRFSAIQSTRIGHSQG